MREELRDPIRRTLPQPRTSPRLAIRILLNIGIAALRRLQPHFLWSPTMMIVSSLCGTSAYYRGRVPIDMCVVWAVRDRPPRAQRQDSVTIFSIFVAV